MEKMILNIIRVVNSYLSDYVLSVLLIASGLYFSISTHFVQLRCFKEGWKNLFGNFSLNGKKDKGSMTSFQAVTTALAAQVGTGNIIGASGAILVGGPGAVFWMWLIAFFGMATSYAEAVLAQKTRVKKPDGTVVGGPVYYINMAFPNRFGKFLAAFFAIGIILATGFMGNMIQANSIGETCSVALGIPTWVVGLVIATLAGFVFLGNVDRIASVTEKMVPIMAILYLGIGVVLIILRIQYIPESLMMIFKYAFQPASILGGTAGSALKQAFSQGVKRGLFSNEAGMGSAPHAHALANVKKLHDQGTQAIVSVFIDTCLVLTMTAIIDISVLYAGDGILAHGAVEGISKTNMAQLALGQVFGTSFGNGFIAVCLFFFAFSTLLSGNLYAKLNVEYLWGEKAAKAFSVLNIFIAFAGACLSNEFVWELGDTMNMLIVFPNVVGILALGKLVKKISMGQE